MFIYYTMVSWPGTRLTFIDRGTWREVQTKGSHRETPRYRYTCDTYICTYIYIYTHTYIHIHIYDISYTHIRHIHMYTHLSLYICIYMYTHMCVCIYIYIYAYTYISFQSQHDSSLFDRVHHVRSPRPLSARSPLAKVSRLMWGLLCRRR